MPSVAAVYDRTLSAGASWIERQRQCPIEIRTFPWSMSTRLYVTMQPIKASPNVGHRFRNQQLLIFVVVVAAAAAAASRSCFFEIVCVCFSQSQRAFLISSFGTFQPPLLNPFSIKLLWLSLVASHSYLFLSASSSEFFLAHFGDSWMALMEQP